MYNDIIEREDLQDQTFKRITECNCRETCTAEPYTSFYFSVPILSRSLFLAAAIVMVPNAGRWLRETHLSQESRSLGWLIPLRILHAKLLHA